jgi:alpha-methylacyl-CoA racemase
MAALGPAPFAAMLLADLGADVTRVDRPSPAPGAESYAMHRGRRSIAVDLKRRDGSAIVLDLVERSDVLLEGGRPGVMERLGLGPEECRARNPRLVYGRMTGWGQTGPLAHTAGHDITYIAASGALGVAARHGERPVPPVNLVGDFGGGGAFLVVGVLAALLERQASGAGQVVDAAMVDGSAVLTTMLHGMLAQGRWQDEAGTNFADTGSPYYEVYRCADGRDVAVGAIEPQFYDRLLEGLGLDGADLPDRRDRRRWPELKARFAEVFATRTRDEWSELFADTDACVAPVLSLTEAPAHPQLAARGTFTLAWGITQPSPAPRFSRSAADLDRPPPAPGAHTDEVLAALGYDRERIAALRRDHVVI